MPSPESIATQPVIHLENVWFSHGADTVLEDVCLQVDQGDFLAVLGPNGGGKTSLLRLILGLLRPDRGLVRVYGHDPESMRPQIGYVPQFSSIRQEFPATVLELTLMGAAHYPPAAGAGFWRNGRLWPSDTTAVEKAMKTLDLLGIADIAGSPLHALSGGQRQRVLVARALTGRAENAPFLLLLDEPTANIDPYGKWCFYEFLESMRGDITLMVVSHEISMASPFFNRVALVNRTLALAPEGRSPSEVMREFIEMHAPSCPIGQSLRHGPDCGCAEQEQEGRNT